MAMMEMLVGYGFVFAGVSLIVKGWKRIYDVKNKKLITGGVYHYIRHPQYAL